MSGASRHWLMYVVGMLFFHVGGFLILYVLMRSQALLMRTCSIRPEQSAVAEDLSFNTAVSFITNTNWQNYGGESTMSYLVQMLGLTHQNFLSAATGIVLAVALIRGFARASAKTVGNFWVDITRCTLYILLPICIPYALFLVWRASRRRSAPMSTPRRSKAPSRPSRSARSRRRSRSRCWAPTAAASSTPMRRIRSRTRPRCRTYVQMISIFAIGAALTNVFGRMVGNQRQGWAIFAVMGVLFISGVIVCYAAEAHGTTMLDMLGLTGGNMEGKEVRFGIVASALFAVITTAASCGAVNAMHDSFTATRRHDPAHQHPARRDHHRRRRRRPLRHAAVRDHRDLRRRSDGRPHARICRQEDRGQGGQDGDARHPGPAADVSRLDRRRHRDPLGGRRHQQCRAARLHRDPLSLHFAAPATTARHSRAFPPTRPSTISPAPSRCSSAASG